MKLRAVPLRLLSSVTRALNRLVSPKVGDTTTEQLFTRLYLDRIRGALESQTEMRILDAGCGVGRLAVPIARDGHRVTGIDYHAASLSVAADAARKVGVTLDLREGELLQSLRTLEDSHFDAAICLEVLYTCVDRDAILRELCRTVRPGGFVIASFASPAYLMGTLLRQGRIMEAEKVLDGHEGVLRLARLPAYYNWTTREAVRTLYASLGLTLTGLYPIGVWTGHGSDAMAAVVDTGQLRTAQETEALYRIETSIQDDQVGMARYHLAVGRKPA